MLYPKKLSNNYNRYIIRPQSLTYQVNRLFVFLICLITAHVIAMVYFEGLQFEEAIWLTLTSITTVGYGDYAAKTFIGRLATIGLIYIGGIAILAQFAGLFFDYRQFKRDRILRGFWRWNMKNHLVFLNAPNHQEDEYFYRTVSELRKSSLPYNDIPIIIVSTKFPNGLSERLSKLGVVHVNGSPFDDESLDSASIYHANVIAILSPKTHSEESDSLVFDLTHHLRELGVKGKIISEVTGDKNRSRVLKMGADHVIRPIRAYPELLVRTILAPGTEQIIEDLFDSIDEECVRYNINIKMKWIDLVQQSLKAGIGTPIGCMDKKGNIYTCPEPEKLFEITAIFVIVGRGNLKTEAFVQQELAA